VKIAVVIIYSIIVGTFTLTTYIRAQLSRIAEQRELEEYLICESRGESADCVQNDNNSTILTIFSVIVVSLLPVIVFFVTFSPKAFKCKSRTAATTSTTNRSS
jgi:hypothetical protein